MKPHYYVSCVDSIFFLSCIPNFYTTTFENFVISANIFTSFAFQTKKSLYFMKSSELLILNNIHSVFESFNQNKTKFGSVDIKA